MLSEKVICAAAKVQSFLCGLRVSQSSLPLYMPKPLDLTWNFQFLPYTHQRIFSSLLRATSCSSTSLLRKTTKATFSVTLFLAFCFPCRNHTVHVTTKQTHRNLFKFSTSCIWQLPLFRQATYYKIQYYVHQQTHKNESQRGAVTF